MKVLYATAEALPYLKTGGLADVSRALPDALHAAGVDVRVMVPAYAGMLDRFPASPEYGTRLPWPGGDAPLRFMLDTRSAAAPAVLVDAPGYLDVEEPYLPTGLDPLALGVRFALFCRAIADYARAWGADVIHLNDWQTGLVPAYLLLQGDAPATVMAIHNLAYQGNFPPALLPRTGLPPELFRTENGIEFHGHASFMKAGIALADRLVTVSPTYAHEIQTPAFGAGMEGLLRFRRRQLQGILNGIDMAYWNPATDPHLAERFSARTLAAKDACRRALIAELQLDDEGPLLVVVSRLVHQKGSDILASALPALLERGVRLALLGSGDPAAEHAFTAAAATHPAQVAFRKGFDEPLAHRLYAGGDFFLMPSRYEPCGLGQLIAQRYGTPPIVRRTGGLVDSVSHGKTGFLFDGATREALLDGVDQAIAMWKGRGWDALRRRCMRLDHSWDRSAGQYIALYHAAAGLDRPQPADGSAPPG
jgi:starch synthase